MVALAEPIAGNDTDLPATVVMLAATYAALKWALTRVFTLLFLRIVLA